MIGPTYFGKFSAAWNYETNLGWLGGTATLLYNINDIR